MSNVVAAGTKKSPWQGSDGIITEAADDTSNNDGAGFKGTSAELCESPQPHVYNA